MNRDEAIKLISDSQLPDIVMALATDAATPEIAQKFNASPSLVMPLGTYLKIDRKGAKRKAWRKGTAACKARSSGKPLDAFKELVKGGVAPSEALNQVSRNFDIPLDVMAGIVKKALNDFEERGGRPSRL